MEGLKRAIKLAREGWGKGSLFAKPGNLLLSPLFISSSDLKKQILIDEKSAALLYSFDLHWQLNVFSVFPLRLRL